MHVNFKISAIKGIIQDLTKLMENEQIAPEPVQNACQAALGQISAIASMEKSHGTEKASTKTRVRK